MKKIITLCLGLMAALSSWAQGFVFQYQGESLADGATVIIAAEEDIFGEMTCETNNPSNPNDGLIVRLLNGTAAPATATLEITYNALNGAALQWCMGAECTPLRNQTSLTKQFTLEGIRLVQFDAVGINGDGYLTATLKVTVGLETHKVNILFINGDYDGIKTIEDGPSAKRDGIYDLNGRRISTEANPFLKKGMYIVTDGNRTRKIAVK